MHTVSTSRMGSTSTRNATAPHLRNPTSQQPPACCTQLRTGMLPRSFVLCPGGGQDMNKTPNDKITPCASSLCLQDGIHLPCDGSSFHLGPAWQGRTRHSTKRLSSLYWEALVLLTTASHHNPVLFFSASRHPKRCYVPRSFRDYL